MLKSLYMVVAAGSELMRVPADWVTDEANPVEVPTSAGVVDLRELARDPGVSVVVDDGKALPFTVTFVREG